MKISIVIPTRERAQYLHYSVQTALAIDDPDIEIIVHDNASADNTADVIAAFDDPRLVYVNSGERVSMRENFNRAFLASTGDYLIYFGDDDGILPGQFRFLRALLEQHKPDGISWIRSTYGWPVPGYGKKTGGIRMFRGTSFGQAYAYDGAQNRENLLACRLMSMTPMPEIYHGCMSRDYMIRTATRPDLIFDSAIPDFNLSYRGVLKGGRFLHADHTFSLNGYSPASTGSGHKVSPKSSGTSQTGALFGAENKTDPVTDVMGHAKSIPLAFFSTLETVRQRHDLMQYRPDYLAWYRYVLGSSRKNPDLNGDLLAILAPHAEATGSTQAFDQARALPLVAKRTWSERSTKWASTLHSLRISAKVGGENTILSGARALDTMLGDEFGKIQAGQQTIGAAWAAAKRRSHQFTRQL